jgi:DUF438 domain-containing protein
LAERNLGEEMAEHWSDLLMDDHQTTEKVLDVVSKALRSPGGPAPEMMGETIRYLVEYTDGCHNKKEEDHLFPLIERRGIPRSGGPLAVMLQEHEQSREILARLRPLAESYAAGDKTPLDELKAIFDQYASLLKDHYWKENDILYPMARKVMSADDEQAVLRGIETTEAALGADTRERYYAVAEGICTSGGLEDLSKGLDPDVLAAMLNTLPVEISFVDAEDRVRYFSHENQKKIFPRTRGAIGMPVQQCHPKKSVHLVNRILEDFKAGCRDVAEFWIDFSETKVHIRYWPVRSPSGEYLGCLETVQDVTAIQALTGQRRLLDDDQPT